VTPTTGWVGHIPAHLAPGAHYRDRRTPLISEVPVYLGEGGASRLSFIASRRAFRCWRCRVRHVGFGSRLRRARELQAKRSLDAGPTLWDVPDVERRSEW
jgi:hypothetical protein